MKTKLLEALRQRIIEAGLTEHSEAILATVRPAVDLVLNGPSQGNIGESRFGGAPDLPVSMEWPRNADGEALVFLLQINLGEIPTFESNPFPAQGMFYVFVGTDEPASDVEHRLIVWEGEAELRLAVVPDTSEFAEEDFLGLLPQCLRLELRADTPHWATSDFQALLEGIDSDDEEDRFYELERNRNGEACIGQLLGHVSGIGHDPREDAFLLRDVHPEANIYNRFYRQIAAERMGEIKHWVNLLRLDSIMELDFCIWDAGYLNFLIRDNDLEALQFERVYAEVQSS